MRIGWLALGVVAACGGDADWDGAVADFEDGVCTTLCSTVPEDVCRQDVQAGLAAAKAMLDPVGEQLCIDCLDTKLRLIPQIEIESCQPTLAQTREIMTACGVDDEACAGFP